MSLGYEGHIKIGSSYALGTGTSVPRNRNKIESSSAYGGTIDGSDRGIGLPRAYDWEIYDGSVNFELTRGLLTSELKTWIAARQTAKTIFFAPRESGVQQYNNSFFNSISISASDGGLVDGSVGFVAIERSGYSYGNEYISNKEGDGLLCPVASFPRQLNATPSNRGPIPWWNTTLTLDGVVYEFITWSLEVSQEVVKFFGCEVTANPVEPKFLAVGPMSVNLSGSYMADFGTAPKGFPGDTVGAASLNIAGETFSMSLLEASSESDDVQGGDSMVPLNIDYAVYGIGP